MAALQPSHSHSCLPSPPASLLPPGKYDAAVVEEEGIPLERRVVAKAGKMDAKKRLEASVQQMISSNIVQCMGAMVDTVAF